MIHDPLISDGIGGSALQVQDVSNRLLKSRRELCTILSECTGRSLQQIYRKTGKDTFFDAKGAVAFGLADCIIQKI